MSPIISARGGIASSAYGQFALVAATAPTLTGSFDALATYTVPSGGVSSITFAGLPTGGQYQHLQIRALIKSSRSAPNDYMKMQFNGDTTSSNYRSHAIDGDGTGVYAENSTNELALGYLPGNSSASMFGVGVIDILDYANISKYKTIKSLGGFNQNASPGAYNWIGLASGLWMNTSPVTSITFISGTSSNFVEFSQFSLYGVKG